MTLEIHKVSPMIAPVHCCGRVSRLQRKEGALRESLEDSLS